MSDSELALLGHLIGDGCTLPSHAIQYTSKDLDLAEMVAHLATDVFGDTVTPRIKQERSWYQVYLAATKHLTHRTRNPVAVWLAELGVFGLRSFEKRVPAGIFAQNREGIATFLRHLWATDGCMKSDAVSPVIRYDSSSEQLSRDVQNLLLRLRINAVLRRVSMGSKGRPSFRLDVSGRDDAQRFLEAIGSVGYRKFVHHVGTLRRFDRQRPPNTNRDVVPREAWQTLVAPAMAKAGITTRAMQARIGTRYCGSPLYRQNMGRERALRVAEAVGSEELRRLATSDVYWDEIVSIEPGGEEDVYDLTVGDLSNFCAGSICLHNSIEQDSDLVIFIYRDEYYNDESDQQGLAEVILAKHRNGPTDSVKLSFLKRYAKFADLAAGA
jgi:replicative DNA helicase